MKKLVRCFECDSEYIIEYDDGLLSDDPQYCMVCKEQVDLVELDDTVGDDSDD